MSPRARHRPSVAPRGACRHPHAERHRTQHRRLTTAAVRVFEELCTLARLNQGRVYPSYDRLAEATALGRATIARALQALKRCGFLVRQRRFKRVEGEGPRYCQTSNAYRPLLPARVLALLPRWMRPTPIPIDQEQHRLIGLGLGRIDIHRSQIMAAARWTKPVK
jgi:biotin operon repressor